MLGTVARGVAGGIGEIADALRENGIPSADRPMRRGA
jgi:hypothetical protein